MQFYETSCYGVKTLRAQPARTPHTAHSTKGAHLSSGKSNLGDLNEFLKSFFFLEECKVVINKLT